MLDGISSACVGGGRAGGRAGWVRESERAEEADRSTTGGPFFLRITLTPVKIKQLSLDSVSDGAVMSSTVVTNRLLSADGC